MYELSEIDSIDFIHEPAIEHNIYMFHLISTTRSSYLVISCTSY